VTLDGGPDLDATLEQLPQRAAVFLIWAEAGRPYLARTSSLRRRLKRLLGVRAQESRLLHLRSVMRRVEYWETGSRLAASLLLYELAKRYFPEDYGKRLKIRWPSYVKLSLSNPFPRTMVTTRLGGSGLAVGPFRSRASAEQFEQEMLDLFQIRRCQENLAPSPDHPGCIYGEMGRCLRPCQQVVSPAEYLCEVERVQQFLSTGGASGLESAATERARYSEAMDFEGAQRQHQRYQRVEQALRLRENLATNTERLSGVAVSPSAEPNVVDLRFLLQGAWLPAVFMATGGAAEGETFDQRLREAIALLAPRKVSVREHQEHLALLARWFYASSRDGEWLPFEDAVPYRRLANAIGRMAKGATGCISA
jgi:excinuclease ABC subunit C